MIEMTDVELAYAAGIMDGEGTIGIYRSYAPDRKGGKKREVALLRPCVSVAQCDIRLPEWLQQKFGCGYIHNQGVPKSGRRVVYTWQVWGFTSVVPVLEALKPFLFLKRDRAEIALEFCAQNINIRHLPEAEKVLAIAKREKLVRELKDCNRRGLASAAETERSRAAREVRAAMRQSELQGKQLAEAGRNAVPSAIGGNIN